MRVGTMPVGVLVAQVGQGVVVVAAIASVTIMVVAGKIDGSVALGVILGAVGIGSGATVGVHAASLAVAAKEPVTPPQEAPHVG